MAAGKSIGTVHRRMACSVKFRYLCIASGASPVVGRRREIDLFSQIEAARNQNVSNLSFSSDESD